MNEKENKMDLTKALVENIVKVQFDDLNEEVKEATKRSILDTLGVMLPPTTLSKECINIAEMAKEAGGKEESTLIGFGGKLPCCTASFINGCLTHPIDYDDTTEVPPHHPTASTFPAALAIAERIGGISGKDFITAVALGNDLSIRLASGPKGSTFLDYPWFPVTVFGTFSAAIAPAKLMRLSEENMTNALGIALSRVFSAATEVMVDPNSEIRSIRDGFTNKEGILSALLAERGIAASKDPIEKLYKIYYSNEYDSKVITQDLGKIFRGVAAGLKPWPTTKQTQGHIEAALHLTKENSITPDQIEEVILTVGEFRKNYLCEPLEAKRNPKHGINAKFSLPFTVAVALVKGRIEIGDFLPQGLTDPKVLEMAGRIKYIFDPEFGVLIPAVVDIRTKNGKVFSERIEIVYGGPQNPLSNEDLVAKFKDCAQYARNPISSDKADKLIEGIFNLEKVKDMREITDLLS